MRPFLTEEIVLANYEDDRNLHNEDELRDLLAEKVDEMLSSMHEENQTTPMTADAESRLRYPIVRLKVDYTGYSTINMQRFGQRFVDKVANPTSLLHFHRKAKRKGEGGDGKDGGGNKKQGDRNSVDTGGEDGEDGTQTQIQVRREPSQPLQQHSKRAVRQRNSSTAAAALPSEPLSKTPPLPFPPCPGPRRRLPSIWQGSAPSTRPQDDRRGGLREGR